MQPFFPLQTTRGSRRPVMGFLASAAGALALSSCVSVTRLVDEPRMSVSFSSSESARLFMEAAYVPPSPNNRGSVNFFTVPHYGKMKTAQHRYNDFVRAADHDSDRLIDLNEAKSFAEARQRTFERRR